MKNTFRFIAVAFLNYLVIFMSKDINVEQLLKDIDLFFNIDLINTNIVFGFITISVALLTILMIYFLNPFIEVYLMYYLRFSFYFLINLVSVSTIYIVYRIYGYSRLWLLIYLFLSSLVMYISDKKINFKAKV
tara:strand:+ start:847 stop:1245 length:399 start_codon:yes stop_codon:yes gene_type:complete